MPKQLDYWIISQFHHGILEPPMKINVCHCQFILMLLNIHSFLGPLPIGIPFHWLFASRSWFSLPMEVCWARHPPIIADHHDTLAVTGGLQPLLDTSTKIAVSLGCIVNLRTSSFRTNWYHLMPSSIRRHHWSSASILRASIIDIAQLSTEQRKTVSND